MKVLVVPEDFRKDQFILKPLLSHLLASLGKPRATVMSVRIRCWAASKRR